MVRIFIFLFLLLSTPAFGETYAVDYANSHVRFSGIHADKKFTGEFRNWKADIKFNPADLANSQLTATFEVGSAKTGNALYDGTLPKLDWFNIRKFSKATFRTLTIRQDGDQTYIASGELTIRGIVKPIIFKFQVSDLSQEKVKARGTLAVNRLDFNVGIKSDPKAEWVSREITIDIDIIANKIKS